MRSLEKNKRKCYYALPIGENRIMDEYGNETLEIETIYDEPKRLMVNYSAAVGQEVVEIFGAATDYSRVLSIVGDCPLTEGTVLWIDADPEESEANYKVRRIANSINSTLVAVGELI